MAQYTELDSPAAVVRGLRSSSTIGSYRKLKGKDLAASPGPPTRMKDHDATLPIRHGLTLMRQFVPLVETDRLVSSYADGARDKRNRSGIDVSRSRLACALG